MLTTGQSLAQVVDMTNKELAAVGGRLDGFLSDLLVPLEGVTN